MAYAATMKPMAVSMGECYTTAKEVNGDQQGLDGERKLKRWEDLQWLTLRCGSGRS